jgi:hypothetical protein
MAPLSRDVPKADGATKPSVRLSASAASSALGFLVKTRSLVTMTLYTNSVFIAAPPCRGGPHRIDPQVADPHTTRVLGLEDLASAELDNGPDAKAIPVVNAAGSGIAVALARAWCCMEGVNAVFWSSGRRDL